MNPSPPSESFWRRWVMRPVVTQLVQGTTPPQIAKAIAWGVTIGVFPLLGTPTLLSLAVGIPLRLNQPVLQIFRELSYPLHLALILVFIHAGEALFGAPHLTLSLSDLSARFFESPSAFLQHFGMLGVYAVSAWALVAPAIFGGAYFIALPVVGRIASRKRSPTYGN